MDQTKADQFKQAIIDRAIQLGMDTNDRNTCSPGIKALAQMYAIVVRYPDLLIAFEDDLLVHDFRLLSSPHTPHQFVWTIRPGGTTLFFPDTRTSRDFRYHMQIETGSIAFTFDGDKLERVHNLDHAAQFLSQSEERAA